MYKRAEELKVDDMWVNSIGCLFRVVSVERVSLRGGEYVEVRHPGGLGHVLKAKDMVEYI